MGSGTGYWAWQLSQLGVDVLAYDAYPPALSTENYHHCPRNENRELTGEHGNSYFPVQTGTPEILAQHADRTLFLCWPPYDEPMAAECLQHYAGNRLVYIGEGDGGCTGDDAFHEMLEQEWEEVASHRLIQWEGIHDWATVYDRVTTQNFVVS